MKIIVKNKVFMVKDELTSEEKQVTYGQFYLVTESGYEVPIKPIFKQDRNVLLSLAEDLR